ncbi:histone-fold-containing protein [Syncephalastrum racemosum]|uniref:Histone-fold-containing protein n=1 Tax=Syncephalastrum racemosum TaxID=13706 RepID=A0A1X2HV10_SYNRA|nr:histone-fold-containing protein [Syncephalastrum racemosum]
MAEEGSTKAQTETQHSQPPTQQQQQERTPGTTILPIARVKRVIKDDKDVNLINNEATFCVTAATELFMEYLVSEGLNRARKDKRKTIFYKDLASAVSSIEQFEFLEDVIPHTMTLKSALERRKEALNEEDTPPAKKQKTHRPQEDEKMDTEDQQQTSSSTPA